MADGSDIVRANALALAALDHQRAALERLAYAAELYRMPKWERAGVEIALTTTIELLLKNGVPQSSVEPIQGVAQALSDLDGGSRPALLQGPGGRRGVEMPFSIARQHGVAAAAVDIAMKKPMTLDDAARWVARKVAKWPAMRRVRREEPWKAVKNWREHALDGRAARDVDASIYALLVATAEKEGVTGDNAPGYAADKLARYGRGLKE